MDRLSPVVEPWNTRQQEKFLTDRFIPDRRLALNNYDRQEGPQEIMFGEDDPQNVSIKQIYNQEVLGGRNKEPDPDEQLRPFKNKNILRYGAHHFEPANENELSPMGICQSHTQRVRKVSKVPCKVLDAPALQDDFYLNLIDWSGTNQLAVGLGHCIYLWNADTSKVTKLCELGNDLVTSVGWAPNNATLAIGCNRG